jgi:2-hydroxychromene-2-carboxylate isomerase
MRRLQFWFEFASTYSYVAALRMERVAGAAGVTVDWRPFLLGPIFRGQGWGDSPFNIYPVKGRYMWRDMERLCAAEGLPLKRPSQFPRNGLLAARVATLEEAAPWRSEFVRRIYTANFADDRDIGAPVVVGGVLEALGLPAAEILEGAHGPENRERLRSQNEEAVRLGIFGAPSFTVDGELFWGNDRLEQAVAWCSRCCA